MASPSGKTIDQLPKIKEVQKFVGTSSITLATVVTLGLCTPSGRG